MADDNNKTDSFSPEYPKPQEKQEKEKDLPKKIGDKMKEEAGGKQEEVMAGDEIIGNTIQNNIDFIKSEDKEEISAEREEIVNEAGKDVEGLEEDVEEVITEKPEEKTLRKELEQKIGELNARKLEVEKLINDFNSVGEENKNRDLIDGYKKEKEELEIRLQRLNYKLKTVPKKEQIPPEEPEKEMMEDEKEIKNIVNKVKEEGKISPEEEKFILEEIRKKESEFYKETSKEEREKLGKEFLKYDDLDDEEKKRREFEIEEAKKKFAEDEKIAVENEEEIERKISELEKELKEKFENYADMKVQLATVCESSDTKERKEMEPVLDQLKEICKYNLKLEKLFYIRQYNADKKIGSIEEQIKDPEALLNSCDRRKTGIENWEKTIAMLDKNFEEISEEEKSFFRELLDWIKKNPKKAALAAALIAVVVIAAPHAAPYITAENLGKVAIAGAGAVALKKLKPQMKRLAEIGGTAAIVGLLLLNDNWGSIDDFAEWACGMKIPNWAKRFEDKSKK